MNQLGAGSSSSEGSERVQGEHIGGRPDVGRVRQSVDRLVSELSLEERWGVRHDALAEIARALADEIDGGKARLAAAAIAKELRAVLAELTGDASDPEDDFDRWTAELSTPVLHTPELG